MDLIGGRVESNAQAIGAAVGFAERVIAWQLEHGRHDLPWQKSRDPYAIWVAEIMLQQTQVATVIPYYRRFMQRFPDLAALASASGDDVLELWSGLGYYSRARNLQRAALELMRMHRGKFPRTAAAIGELPGVGRSTAGAIAALAFGARHAVLDGNVKRVLCRCFAVDGDPSGGATERALWSLAERLLPRQHVQAYIQGMMDLGATVCMRRRPQCARCPLAAQCIARRLGRVDELPRTRRRVPLPQRDVVMLVLHHRAQVLLERRPASGIWGGLWSLPESVPGEDPRPLCARRFGAHVLDITPLPAVRHGFTHFRLRIEPLRIDVDALDTRVAEPGLAWWPIEEARTAALPAPIRRILERE
ncbi:MAG: A/G-specific adenine glycosylase [Burkholderiales bacterium]|nr:A/G-specific adenine glycosylase [Burkholderiales bacterium]